MVTGGISSPREIYYFRPEAAAGEELVQLSGSLSMGRVRHRSGLLPDGTVVIVGGSWSSGPRPSPTSDIFDPVTESVVPGPNLNQARYAPSGTSMNGKFYVCGLYPNVTGGTQCEVYDPALNNWQPIASPQFNYNHIDLGKQTVEQNKSHFAVQFDALETGRKSV